MARAGEGRGWVEGGKGAEAGASGGVATAEKGCTQREMQTRMLPHHRAQRSSVNPTMAKGQPCRKAQSAPLL